MQSLSVQMKHAHMQENCVKFQSNANGAALKNSVKPT